MQESRSFGRGPRLARAKRERSVMRGVGTVGGRSSSAICASLTIYLGHVAPADTYWYLSAAPELMELAAQRLHARFGTQP